MTSPAMAARHGVWRTQGTTPTRPRRTWPQQDRIEFEEHEPAGSDGGWTVGYLDVLLILVTLFAALLGASFLQMDDLRSIRGNEAPPSAELSPSSAPSAATEAGADPEPVRVAVTQLGPDPTTPPVPAALVAPTPAPTATQAPPPSDTAAVEPGPLPASTASSSPEISFAEPAQTAEPVTTAAAAEAASVAAAPAIPAEFQVLVDLLAIHGEQQHLELLLDRHQLRLEVGNDILFPSGTADLTAPGRSLLADVAEALHDDQLEISVEGHTDDVPINTARFPSNWELSSIRATTVARELIALGIPEHRLRVTGHADTRPRAANDSPVSRALNRRVSLVLEWAEAPLPRE